jgi:hypothetical protein
LVVVIGLCADAVVAAILAVPAPFLLDEAIPDFLAGEAFLLATVLLATVFLAGAFCWTAVAPSAFQASTIIAAMAAQLKIFLMDSMVSVTIS